MKESLNTTIIHRENNDEGWQINPVKVKTIDFVGEEAREYDANLDNPGRDYTDSECTSPTSSICESPVKQGHQVYQISPGKLKNHVSIGTREVLE